MTSSAEVRCALRWGSVNRNVAPGPERPATARHDATRLEKHGEREMRAVRLLREGDRADSLPDPTRKGHDHFMAEFLQLLADPDRMCSGLHRHTCWRQIREPLLNRLGRGSKRPLSTTWPSSLRVQ